MRVRLTRQTETRRRTTPDRRRHVVAAPPPAEAPEQRAESVEADADLAAERRLRDSGGPEDQALYRCGCGFVFEAPVSTSVACPHCGSDQAW
jgi:hypothetical protein